LNNGKTVNTRKLALDASNVMKLKKMILTHLNMKEKQSQQSLHLKIVQSATLKKPISLLQVTMPMPE